MIVRELVTRLGFSVNDGQMKKYETGVNNIKNSAEGAANAFRNMFAAFVGFSAAQSLAKTADTMQSLEARVGMLPQTVNDAGAAFDEVGNRANMARQSIDAYANLYIKLQNAGSDYIKTQEEGLQITDTLSKALVVGGASAQEQSSAMLQFAQAIGSGVLQGDELRAMAEASPMFMAELAKSMKIPKEEIKKMGSEGKLTSKAVVEAVKKMANVFDERFKQMPMTISQAITIGQNRWAMFINNLNRKSGTVTAIANFLLDGFDKLEKKLNEFVEFMGGATQTVKFFGLALVAAFGPAAIGLVVGGFAAIFTAGGALFAVLLLLALVVEDVYQFFTGGESILGDFVGWLRSGSAAATTMALVLTVLAGALVLVALGFAAAWVAALSGPALVVLGLIALYGAFLYFKDEVFKIMSDLWMSITGGFNSMIEGLKSAWTGFKSFFTGGVNANVSASTVAGAAVSSGGVGGTRQSTTNNTINQTLPPGSTPEMAEAARAGTEKALQAADNGALARQMGQAQ